MENMIAEQQQCVDKLWNIVASKLMQHGGTKSNP